MSVDKKAQEIIEYIWGVWYGHHRGVMNSEQISDLLTEAKIKIVKLVEEH